MKDKRIPMRYNDRESSLASEQNTKQQMKLENGKEYNKAAQYLKIFAKEI